MPLPLQHQDSPTFRFFQSSKYWIFIFQKFIPVFPFQETECSVLQPLFIAYCIVNRMNSIPSDDWFFVSTAFDPPTSQTSHDYPWTHSSNDPSLHLQLPFRRFARPRNTKQQVSSADDNLNKLNEIRPQWKFEKWTSHCSVSTELVRTPSSIENNRNGQPKRTRHG